LQAVAKATAEEKELQAKVNAPERPPFRRIYDIHNKTSKKPIFVKYGLNHAVALIEAKKASLVVLAHDVNPIELVVFVPALCRKMGVPYVIVKGKARLGTVVHKKTAAILVVSEVKSEDERELSTIVSAAKANLWVPLPLRFNLVFYADTPPIALTSTRSTVVNGEAASVATSRHRCCENVPKQQARVRPRPLWGDCEDSARSMTCSSMFFPMS
jgi:ribosomal protein L7Ae-like RNA K-turn-binding protein